MYLAIYIIVYTFQCKSCCLIIPGDSEFHHIFNLRCHCLILLSCITSGLIFMSRDVGCKSVCFAFC